MEGYPIDRRNQRCVCLFFASWIRRGRGHEGTAKCLHWDTLTTTGQGSRSPTARDLDGSPGWEQGGGLGDGEQVHKTGREKAHPEYASSGARTQGCMEEGPSP